MIESLDLNTLTVLIPIITTIIGGIAAINEKIKNKDLMGALNLATGLYDSVMNALNPLTNIDTVPDELKTGFNSAIFKTTEKERNKITADLPIAEKLSINTYIDTKELNGCNYYKIGTSKGEYVIENGYIDDFFPIEEFVVPVGKDYNSQVVGGVSLTNITSEGIIIYDGVSLKQDLFVGKPIDIEFNGEKRGDVVVGAFFDGQLIGKNEFDVMYQDGDIDVEYATFRFPQYTEKTSDKVAFDVGLHTLEIKTGYVSGYSSYNGEAGSSSDQITYLSTNTFKINVCE